MLSDTDVKRSLVMYTDFPEAAKLLSDKAFREVVEGACYYTEHGEVREMSTEAALIFSYMKTTLDRDIAKWKDTRQKRSEAGQKGMAARWGKSDNNYNK